MGKSDFETIEVYLHKYKLEALLPELDEQGIDIQDYMQDRLIELYTEFVPYETQQEIRRRIDEEKAPAKNTQRKGAER